MEFDTRLFEFTEDEKAELRDRHAASQAMLSPYACRDDEGIRGSTSATKTGCLPQAPVFRRRRREDRPQPVLLALRG